MTASEDGERRATVPSREAVARRRPQGENRTQEMARACGVAARTCRYGRYGGAAGGGCCCVAEDMVGGIGKGENGKDPMICPSGVATGK